jgi:putative transposase
MTLWVAPDAVPTPIRPLDRDSRHGTFFAAHQIAVIDLTNAQTVGDVSEQASAMSPG